MSYLISVTDSRSKVNVKDTFILNYLSNELNKTKSKIDIHIKGWDKIKKKIHDYEYVYYSSYRKKNVSCISAASRSYFKFREIYYEYNLHIEKGSHVFCLAEAPGGFIQSIIHLSNGQHIKIYGNSLLSGDNSIPIWNNAIKRFQVSYIYGRKKDGDLCDFSNLLTMIQEIGKSSCHLVTGDGGFDYSSDYSKQEFNSLRLIYSEIFMALNIQKRGGTFICKIFDTFTTETIDLLYLLNLSYEKVYLHKPKMSRNSNSEKYVVCLKFKGYNKNLVNRMCLSFKTLKLNILPSCVFYDNLLRYIIDYTLQQIKSINKGIDMIQNNVIEVYPSGKQLRMAIEWCEKYDIKINSNCIYLNSSDITR